MFHQLLPKTAYASAAALGSTSFPFEHFVFVYHRLLLLTAEHHKERVRRFTLLRGRTITKDRVRCSSRMNASRNYQEWFFHLSASSLLYTRGCGQCGLRVLVARLQRRGCRVTTGYAMC